MLRSFSKELLPAAAMLAVSSLLCGVVYPLAVTGGARLLAPHRAGGSLIDAEGAAIAEGERPIGSPLIGQAFDGPGWFWSRPSATSPAYDAGASSGSNLGPTHPALREAVEARVAALRASDPDNLSPIPVDLVTASGSGLDPHVSPAAALWQVPRVARERSLPEERVRALVGDHVEGPLLGVLGEPCVNVLELNLALDELSPIPRTE